MKYKLALIGSPVCHSKSPDIYAKIFRDNRVDGSFTVFDLKNTENVRDIMQKAGIDAFAVTMPHKRSIIAELDQIDTAAKELESVNFVTIKDGVFKGYTTDGEGFCRGLARSGIDCKGESVLIYGTGGAARSVCYSLKKHNANVSVCGRTDSHVRAFCEKHGTVPDKLINAGRYDIFINATPLGMTADFENFDFLTGESVPLCVCDLVYSPARTRLAAFAENHGISAINGLPMLHEQAQLAFEILSGKSLSDD